MEATILVVEDRKDTRDLLRTALEKGGYTVNTVETGEEGLDSVEEEKPDLILLDFMLPGMPGETVLQKLQENDDTKDIPVVFLTAAAMGESEKDLLEMQGAKAVLLKPIKMVNLINTIEDVLTTA